MLMLSLDDAVRVCIRLLHETTYFDDMQAEEYGDAYKFIRGELEQKCWFPPKSDDAAKHLNDLIFDINPAEICAQIGADNLRNWCRTVQTEMKMALVKLPCWSGEGEE